MFACVYFSSFLVCYSGYLCDNKSKEKHYVAICGGSISRLSGLVCQHNGDNVVRFVRRGIHLTDDPLPCIFFHGN